MWLTSGGHLFTVGPYSTLRRYDLASGESDWQDATRSRHTAFNRDRSRFAVIPETGHSIGIYDTATGEQTHEIGMDFTVRGGDLAFTQTGLAFATDYGYLGWYPLSADS